MPQSPDASAIAVSASLYYSLQYWRGGAPSTPPFCFTQCVYMLIIKGKIHPVKIRTVKKVVFFPCDWFSDSCSSYKIQFDSRKRFQKSKNNRQLWSESLRFEERHKKKKKYNNKTQEENRPEPTAASRVQSSWCGWTEGYRVTIIMTSSEHHNDVTHTRARSESKGAFRRFLLTRNVKKMSSLSPRCSS